MDSNKFSVLVCGGRDYGDGDFLFKCLFGLAQTVEVMEIVAGEAPGADTLAREWARAYGFPYIGFPADWNQHGRGAGPVRNRKMAAYVLSSPYSKLALAFGGGRGTNDMCSVAMSNNFTVIRHV